MYWLIEPHADDVFLSLHQHIVSRWKDIPKTIVTVFADHRRQREAAVYARAVGCSHISLGLTESGSLKSTAPAIPPITDWDLSIRTTDQLIFPLGLQHPDHCRKLQYHRY